MSSSVAAEKASLAAIQQKTRDLSNRREAIEALELELKGLIELERVVDAQKDKIEETKRALMRVTAAREGKKIESDGLKARLDVSETDLPPKKVSTWGVWELMQD